MNDTKLLNYLEERLRLFQSYRTRSLKLTSKLDHDGRTTLYRIGSGCWKRTLREAIESGATNR
jgi:hypothetical protein